jgi:hypothetical protein
MGKNQRVSNGNQTVPECFLVGGAIPLPQLSFAQHCACKPCAGLKLGAKTSGCLVTKQSFILSKETALDGTTLRVIQHCKLPNENRMKMVRKIFQTKT